MQYGLWAKLLQRLSTSSGNRDGGIARLRLEHDTGQGYAGLRRLFGHNKSVLGIGHHQRRDIALGIVDAEEGLLEKTGIARQRQKLLWSSRS